jgi:hypothetical protein
MGDSGGGGSGGAALALLGVVVFVLMGLGLMGGAAVSTLPTQSVPNPASAAQDRAWQRQEQVMPVQQQYQQQAPAVQYVQPQVQQVAHGVRFSDVAPTYDYWNGYLDEMRRMGFTVDTGSHAVDRHASDAFLVREHFRALVQNEPIIGQQPPCRDGRHRFTSKIGNRFAVWVLAEKAPGVFQEITAFMTADLNYVSKVRDDCGNSSWLGHAYGY